MSKNKDKAKAYLESLGINMPDIMISSAPDGVRQFAQDMLDKFNSGGIDSETAEGIGEILDAEKSVSALDGISEIISALLDAGSN